MQRIPLHLLCYYAKLLCERILLTDARAFPISSPELPGTTTRLAFGEEIKAFPFNPMLINNSAM